MSRAMFILLAIGFAGLALVGCSKNNIAGPQAALDNQYPAAVDRAAALDRRAVGRMAVPREEAQANYGETGDRLAQVREFETADRLPEWRDFETVSDRLAGWGLQGRPAVQALEQEVIGSAAPAKGDAVAATDATF